MAVWPGVQTSTRRKRAQRSGRGRIRWRPLLPACCSILVGIAHCSIKAPPAPWLKHTVRITSKQHTQSTPRHSLCSSSAADLRSFSPRPLLHWLLFLSPPSLSLCLYLEGPPLLLSSNWGEKKRKNERMSEGGGEGGRRSTSARRTEKQHGPGERNTDEQRQRGDRAHQKSSCRSLTVLK